MLRTIPPDIWQINAIEPQALTRLLALPEFVVRALEHDERLDCLVVLCEHAHATDRCPTCGTLSARPHQYAPRAVRDLSLAGQVCYLEFVGRRFTCPQCRQPFTEVLEAVAPHARCTRRYERYLFAPRRGSTIQDVARRERLGYKAVEGHYYRLAADHNPAAAPELVRRLGIDEIALKKEHRQYALILSDLDRKRIIAVLPERTKEALEA